MVTSIGRLLFRSRGQRPLAVLLAALLSGCHANKQAPSADAGSTADSSASVAPIGSHVPAATAAPSAVALGDAPDVRVMLAAPSKAVVKVGQTFGILVPFADDFLDEWELEAGCPLGEPLTFISRGGDVGRELLWKIADDKVGTHVVKLRLMHRRTRTSKPTTTKRAQVTVDVVRP